MNPDSPLIGRRTLLALVPVAAAGIALGGAPSPAAAASAADIDTQSTLALRKLTSKNAAAAAISAKAKAVLVFPNIIKAGFVFGAAYGEGALFEGSRAVDYFNTFSGSWGLQAGAESFGYALFLMNGKALDYLKKSNGWEIGVGPTVVVVNEGVAKNLSSTTLQDDAYAFIFDQQGLMLSVSIEGTKISRIKR